MPLEGVCSQCGTRLRIQEKHQSRTIKCPECEATVPVEGFTKEDPAPSPFVSSDVAGAGEEAVNPYASPEGASSDVAVSEDADAQAITVGIRTALQQTRPWVLLFAVLGFLVAAIAVLVGLGASASLLISGEPVGVLLGLFYVGYGALYFGGAYYLMAYARRIGRFLDSGAGGDLESALVAQKSFWKLAGVTVVVCFVLGVLLVLGGIVVGTVVS